MSENKVVFGNNKLKPKEEIVDYITIVVAPTGAGKNYLLANIEDYGYINSVSNTTRAKRANEVDGVDYHFNTIEEFEEIGDFIEYVEFGGNKYGMREAEIEKILDQNKKPYLIVEPSGMIEIIEWVLYNNDKKFKDLEIRIIYLDIDRETRYQNILNSYLDLGMTEEKAIESTEDRINRNGDSIPEKMKEALISFKDYEEEFNVEKRIKLVHIHSKEEMGILIEKLETYNIDQINEFLEELKSGQIYMEFN